MTWQPPPDDAREPSHPEEPPETGLGPPNRPEPPPPATPPPPPPPPPGQPPDRPPGTPPEAQQPAEPTPRWEPQYGQPQQYGEPQHYGEPQQYGPGYAQYEGYSHYQPYAASKGTNVLAVVALVLSIFLPLIGAILGHVSRRQIKQSGETGDGLALAAIIIGWTLTGLALIGCCIAVVVGLSVPNVNNG